MWSCWKRQDVTQKYMSQALFVVVANATPDWGAEEVHGESKVGWRWFKDSERKPTATQEKGTKKLGIVQSGKKSLEADFLLALSLQRLLGRSETVFSNGTKQEGMS